MHSPLPSPAARWHRPSARANRLLLGLLALLAAAAWSRPAPQGPEAAGVTVAAK